MLQKVLSFPTDNARSGKRTNHTIIPRMTKSTVEQFVHLNFVKVCESVTCPNCCQKWSSVSACLVLLNL